MRRFPQQITVNLSPELHEKLRTAALQRETSPASIIRWLIRNLPEPAAVPVEGREGAA